MINSRTLLMMAAVALLTACGERDTILPGERLDVRDLDTEEGDDRWVTEWDGETKRSLPRAVRMSLRDNGGRELRWVFPIMVRVMAPS